MIKTKYAIIFMILLIGCTELGGSTSFSLGQKSITRSSGDSSIQVGIIFNRDITVSSCNMAYVDEFGKEYKLNNDFYYKLQDQCKGLHYSGGKIFIAGVFDSYFNNKEGEAIITLTDGNSVVHTVKFENEQASEWALEN
tara:strand:+ start:954 stop:1370 length:417 start_codon:yes stop_codon:yes gene_type:complete